MAEALVGDITPVDGVEKGEKSRREASTMDFMAKGLLGGWEGGGQGEVLRVLWEEYERDETPEAEYVHDVDKVELLLQMVEYERRGEGELDLGEFEWVAERVRGHEMKGLCREVLGERKDFWRGVRGEKGVEGAAAEGGGG